MTTRTEIIAHIDVVLNRLERARDYLAASLAGSKRSSQTASALASLKKINLKTAGSAPAPVPAPTRKRKQPAVAAAPVAVVAPLPPPPPAKEEPQIKRVPPRRRMERRHLQTEKATRSGAALSGTVPTGPVAVSANEARKMQERAVPAPTPTVVAEPRREIGAERSLGSLIQAFERRAGLSGLETP
jgi:hypothetical protein